MNIDDLMNKIDTIGGRYGWKEEVRDAIEQALSEARKEERERCAQVCVGLGLIQNRLIHGEHFAAAIRKGR